MKIAILGAGAWGTALALAFAARHEITLWLRDKDYGAAMRQTRENSRYLPGFSLPASLRIETDLALALADVELVVVVVPTAGFRQVLREIHGSAAPVIWGCKGFEVGSAKLPHQVIAEELKPDAKAAVLSGPSFAEEVARGLPTAVTLASDDPGFAREMAKQLHSARLRIYSSSDVVGVEVAGAVKNVLAMAAGISDGMNLGNNARAALMTRGLAEMTRLGLALGGRMETFMGLAGMGDLFLTASSDLSRNRRVGLMLARGKTLSSILEELGHVAEGVTTAKEVQRLGRLVNVDMPITQTICRVLGDGLAPDAALSELLSREPRTEH
ncbi:MAG: NAD(P)H-dependent glycerol-3-phosphate dehydrogenase [Burkholderiales bacterium]